MSFPMRKMVTGCFSVALTAEQRAKGRRIARERLGPAGRSALATRAVMARWHKQEPKKPKLVPPLGLLLAWLEVELDQHDNVPGWALNRGKLAEVIAWLHSLK